MPRIEALENSSSPQRDSLNHQAIEDYLKTIYTLAEVESPVSTSRIAEARQVKPGSVTSMLRRLASLNLVNYEKHYGVTLTENGEKIALEVIRHHRLLELYLMEALGFGWDEVHEQADLLEHVISEKLEERIAAALGYPTLDPHGDPIPDRDGSMMVMHTRPLSDVSPGELAQVARIPADNNSEMLRHLAELGLTPGTLVRVTAVAPFDGPFSIEINGQNKVIGFTVAQAVLVVDA
ncbi:MAG: metal-dependent transcriptional regulator [Chloroflexi bacterium]|jgi:DtxR family Mn-dependent transcriptional regulator|nr:metal-dependent transcriptional regulator [Chloroflexota bacterium]MBK8931476.1 metal-dependent transcriptional regulator [Chloroflexota bacterium]MBP6803698.1 metal-dependent transcriptional regulator [Chloroflexota bacterium]MBP7590815.1 metal-dependent transcriptional regulator [Chloroflexota bacterium]